MQSAGRRATVLASNDTLSLSAGLTSLASASSLDFVWCEYNASSTIHTAAVLSSSAKHGLFYIINLRLLALSAFQLFIFALFSAVSREKVIMRKSLLVDTHTHTQPAANIPLFSLEHTNRRSNAACLCVCVCCAVDAILAHFQLWNDIIIFIRGGERCFIWFSMEYCRCHVIDSQKMI